MKYIYIYFKHAIYKIAPKTENSNKCSPSGGRKNNEKE